MLGDCAAFCGPLLAAPCACEQHARNGTPKGIKMAILRRRMTVHRSRGWRCSRSKQRKNSRGPCPSVQLRAHLTAAEAAHGVAAVRALGSSKNRGNFRHVDSQPTVALRRRGCCRTPPDEAARSASKGRHVRASESVADRDNSTICKMQYWVP